MTDQNATNSGADDANGEVLDEVAGAAEVNLDNTANEGLDEDIDQDAGAAEETEDVTIDGKVHKIPKSLKSAFMAQADYTQKTQTLAEERRAVEAEKAAHVQRIAFHQQFTAEIGKLGAVDEQLARYAALNWDDLEASDPVQAARLYRAYNTLKEQRTGLAQGLSQKQRHMAAEAEEQRSQALDNCRATLQRDIPGWSPEVATNLTNFGQKQGFTGDELATVSDPRVIKVLHLAMLGAEAITKTTTAQRNAQAAAGKPAPTVGGASPAARTTTNATGDALSTAEWMRREQERVSKRRA